MCYGLLVAHPHHRMARVFLLSAAPPPERSDYNLSALRALAASAIADAFRLHALTDDPAAADVILFADLQGAGMQFQAIRRHPLVKAYREKCFVFCSSAFVVPLLPGVYASLEKRWQSRRTSGGFHLLTLQNEFANFSPPSAELPYLYSFIGSTATAPVRRRLAELKHARGFFRDTAAEFDRALYGRMSREEHRDYARRFADVTKASKFVLCPRGRGVATIRLMETMRIGRVPVIISDQWLAPEGPEWNRFSIRVGEDEVSEIPRLLERYEDKAVAMGTLARRQWEEWFSEKAAFHRVVEWCLKIRERRMMAERIGRLPAYLQLLRPFHLRWRLRPRYHALRNILRRGGAR